jgi:hypothetical protein
VKKLTVALAAGALACGLLAAGGAVPAQASSAYTYNCVLTNGSSYFLKPGTALTTCKGSRLQMYYKEGCLHLFFDAQRPARQPGAS